MLEGQVEKFVNKGEYGLLVSDIDAELSSEFDVVKHQILLVIKNIANNLCVEDKGKDIGVLAMTYTVPNKELIRKTFDSIT